MAIVNSDFLNGVLTNFRTLFQGEFAAAQNMQPWREIVTRIPSNTAVESYNFFGSVPKMQDVSHDEPIRQGLQPYQMNITNREFEAVVEIARTALEDDKLGMFTGKIADMGREAARHPGELLFGLFESGGLAFDGVAFFSDTRTLGRSANIDNIQAGTGVTVSAFQTDLGTNRGIMRKFQDDAGRPMNLTPDTIIVPPELEQVAFQALNANQGSILQPAIPATANGSFQGQGYLVMVNPFLTDANDWYLLYRGGNTKPFVFQDRLAPALEGPTSPNTESGAIRRIYPYTARARYEVGYGDPRYAVKITN